MRQLRARPVLPSRRAPNASTDSAATRLQSAHLADELPLAVGHRLHRKAGIFGKRHIFELRLGLDRGEGDRLGQRLDRGGRHCNPRLSFLRGGIGIGFTNDFADADDLFFLTGVIEEKLLALFHLLEIAARDEVAHAAPNLAFAAAFDLIVPGKFLRLGFHQPIGHVRRSNMSRSSGSYASALNGRVNSDSIAASTVILPLSKAATAAEIGMSTARSRAISSRTGAVNTPSASPAWMESGRSPRPSLMPKVKLRDCGLEHVKRRSPKPDRPIIVSGFAPRLCRNAPARQNRAWLAQRVHSRR